MNKKISESEVFRGTIPTIVLWGIYGNEPKLELNIPILQVLKDHAALKDALGCISLQYREKFGIPLPDNVFLGLKSEELIHYPRLASRVKIYHLMNRISKFQVVSSAFMAGLQKLNEQPLEIALETLLTNMIFRKDHIGMDDFFLKVIDLIEEVFQITFSDPEVHSLSQSWWIRQQTVGSLLAWALTQQQARRYAQKFIGKKLAEAA